MRYQCSSVVGCINATDSSFCDLHRRFCKERNCESELLQLVDGVCFDCRIRNARLAGDECDCGYHAEDNRANLRVDGVSRWA